MIISRDAIMKKLLIAGCSSIGGDNVSKEVLMDLRATNEGASGEWIINGRFLRVQGLIWCQQDVGFAPES